MRSQCHRLKGLDVQSCNITDESMLSISTMCKALEVLDISWCVGVTDVGITALSAGADFEKLPYFATLKATWCPNISDQSLIELTSLNSFKLFESSGYLMASECRLKLEQSGIEIRTDIVSS